MGGEAAIFLLPIPFLDDLFCLAAEVFDHFGA
jgi:hypothetical protein